MAAESKIQWTHATFNPWRGCAKVSPGCANCYGGESGAEARQFRLSWALSLVAQCQLAGVAAFVKQVGSEPVIDVPSRLPLAIVAKKGGDESEWPESLRVREFPRIAL